MCFSHHTRTTLSAERMLKKTPVFPKFMEFDTLNHRSALGLKKPPLFCVFHAHACLQDLDECPPPPPPSKGPRSPRVLDALDKTSSPLSPNSVLSHTSHSVQFSAVTPWTPTSVCRTLPFGFSETVLD